MKGTLQLHIHIRHGSIIYEDKQLLIKSERNLH